MLPVIARNLLESVRLLANVSRLFADRCIAGLEADVERCNGTYALSSPAIATALETRYIGYEQCCESRPCVPSPRAGLAPSCWRAV